MLLYNYYIYSDNFIHTISAQSSEDCIYLKETYSLNFLSYPQQYDFYNNQGREVVLYTQENHLNSDSYDSFIFIIKDVISFECFVKTNKIYYKLYKYGTKQLLEYWLSHTLLPIFFTITNKYYFLHAGAVNIDNKTILFMANSMGGKSTLTSHFIKKGHRLISDDKVGIFKKNEKFMTVSSYPYHRPYRNKEDLGNKIDNFETNTTSLGTIYLLDLDIKYKNIKLTELKGIEKFKILINGTEIGLPFFQEDRFKFISKLANNTHIYRINIPKDLNKINEVYDTIINHNKLL